MFAPILYFAHQAIFVAISNFPLNDIQPKHRIQSGLHPVLASEYIYLSYD